MPDLRSATREIAARISEEIDYRHEAANITAFSELYRGHPFIRVPEVIAEASGDRVLTMTYLDGMDWAAAQQADQDLKNTWAEMISRFCHGFLPARQSVPRRPSSRQLSFRLATARSASSTSAASRSCPNNNAAASSEWPRNHSTDASTICAI